jgi:hypothetical protein
MQEAKLKQLTNRHLAKLLNSLDEINTPQIIKDQVMKHFWFFSNDIKDQVLSKEQGNERPAD